MLSEALGVTLSVYLDKLFSHVRDKTLEYINDDLSEYIDTLSELISDELIDRYQHLYIGHLYNATASYIAEDITEHIHEEFAEYIYATLDECISDTLEECVYDGLREYVAYNHLDMIAHAEARQEENMKYTLTKGSEYMTLTNEQISSYCDTLECGKDNKRKTRTALAAWSEYAQRKGITDKPSNEELEDFRREYAARWQRVDMYVGYVRTFFNSVRFVEGEKMETTEREMTEREMTERETTERETAEAIEAPRTEAPKTEAPKTTAKKIQIGVYVLPELYDMLATLAKVWDMSMGELLAQAGEELVNSNREDIEKAKVFFENFKKKRPRR